MWQIYLIAAIVGWCGTGWPRHWPGGGGTPEPGWPDWWCPKCGGLIGAISAVILVAVLGSHVETAGLGGLIAFSFFAGSFGHSLVGTVAGLARG
jgi:hypothetical protein